MIEALRRTGVRFAVLGAAAYLVFLAATLPAAWFGYALERLSDGALSLGDPRGTVWKGRGALAVRSSSGFRGIADIEWRCNPLSVFVGRLSVDVSAAAPGANLRAKVGLGLRSLRLQNVEASAPAGLLDPAVPAVAFAKLEGRWKILADSLEIGPESVRGSATAEWSGAGAIGVAQLGDYRLQVTGSGNQAAIKLATLRGDLRVNGNGEWRASEPKVVKISGVAETSPARKDLEPLLQLLGGEGTGPSRPFGWVMTI